MGENIKSAQSLLEELANNPPKLPYDPSLLRDLFEMTGAKSTASMPKIASVIERGPGLATKVLSLANSAYYSLSSKISSISTAVTVLGLLEVRNLVIILGASAIVKKKHLPEGFKLRELWEHQLITGECSRSICRLVREVNPAFNGPDPDEAYTAALLHDLGKLMIAYLRPDDWTAIRDLAQKEGLTSAEAEEKYWGLDHGSIAGRLLRSWDLPDTLTEPISWHHYPDLAGPYTNAATLLSVSDSLALHGKAALEVWQQGGDADSGMPPKDLQRIQEMGLSMEILLPSMVEAFENSKYLSLAGQL